MRNIVFIHLESFNYMHYQMNRALFPTLQKWEKKSISFSKYFSTATSTLMVVSDLAYGGMLQNEPCDSLTGDLGKYCYADSLLDRLKEAGYRVRAASYPANTAGDIAGCNKRHFIGYTVEMEELESSEMYLQFLEEAMTREAPFAVWACNYVSNVSYNCYMENADRQTGLERWENGYSYMDRCAGDLLDILERKDLLGETTIIFYGDHGDELYAHGRHGGLMHAVEPYEVLIHTPFWIYDSRFQPGEADRLIDTTDIRGIVESLLGLQEGGQGSGVLKLPSRKYSLARNVYAAQKIRENSFHKAYSLTDGRFLFLAGDQGMELYHIGMDPSCQHNLLDYFEFDNGILSLNREAYCRMGFHFPYLLDEGAFQQIEQIFYEYRGVLMAETEAIYQYADCGLLALEIGFDHIHYGREENVRRQDAERQALNPEPGNREEFEVYRRYLEGKRLVLYGAGNYGKYFYRKMAGCVDIAVWVDRGYGHMQQVFGNEIQPPDCVKGLEFDVVFIAIANDEIKKEVKNGLVQMGIPLGKIFQ